MQIKLTNHQFSAAFQILQQIKAPASAVIVAKSVVDNIAKLADEGKAKEITLDLAGYQLAELLEGLTDLLGQAKIGDLAGLEIVAESFKLKTAFLKVLDSKVRKDLTVEIDADDLVDADPVA